MNTRYLIPLIGVTAAVTVAAAIPAVSGIWAADPATTCTIAAAGDIAEANGDQEQTAAVIQSLNPTSVLTLGDNAYPDGSAEDFQKYYAPSWGRFKQITHPAPGNHEYQTHHSSAITESARLERSVVASSICVRLRNVTSLPG